MKKKIILISAAVIALAAICIIGYTLAYFTDTKTLTNTFTIGNVIIVLDESPLAGSDPNEKYKWETNGDARETEGNTYNNIFPGAVLPKDPKVTNMGANDAYVRLRVTVTNAEAWIAAFEAHDIKFLSMFTEIDSDLWDISDPERDLDDDKLTYVFTYKEVLKAGFDDRGDDGTTGALFTSVTIPTEFTSEEMARISNGYVIDDRTGIPYGEEETFIYVTAEAIQAGGFDDYIDAFKAFDAQVNPPVDPVEPENP